MKKSKWCDAVSCCGSKCIEILGLVLVVIASIITIITQNSLGIVAMFVVGALLMCHRHCCKSRCDTEDESCETPKAKTTTRKTTTKS